ncbi:ran-binding protein 3 [Cylas formicarius]|uniref:ran-binding protein 3 n=1 Tax=Cylas formicarius TaxID=197179 RepID=UPI002958B210|nr:ran-binding protein 3 [Cylas formicarius]
MEDVVLGDETKTKPPLTMKIEESKDSNIKGKDVEQLKRAELEPDSLKTPCLNPLVSTQQNKPVKGILKPPQLSLSGNTPNTVANLLKQANLDKDADAKRSNGEVLKFVPLKTNTQITKKTETPAPASNVPASASTTTFVFGQNLEERVMAAEAKPAEGQSLGASSNGVSDMLFSSAVKNDVAKDCPADSSKAKSLSDSAREYEEMRACKRKYDAVEVKTGEEEETNVLSLSCKLFSFDKDSSTWHERGRGTLRLNDFEVDENMTGSRLVFRTTGSLRVILNTKIWAEMTIEKASDKSIRLTALDSNGEVKIFLIMATIEDARHLYAHLKPRLEKEVLAQKRPKTSSDEGETK